MLTDLYKIRMSKKMSTKELSKLSRIPVATINRIENGNTIPRINIVCKLSNALQIDSTELFDILIANEDF